MKCFYSLLLTLVLLSLARCELFSSEQETQFLVSEMPALWEETFPDLDLLVTVFTADGVYRINTVTFATGRPLTLAIPKAPTVYILAVPCLQETPISLIPFGAVSGYCDVKSTEPVILSFAGGFVAQRCLSLVKKGYDISLFNAEKLVRSFVESDQDPWAYNTVIIEEDIATGVFNTFSMKKLPAFSHEVLLLSGTWFTENPSVQPMVSDGSLPVSTGLLTAGYHSLFRAGTPDYTELMVTEHEALLFPK
ncbi:MAG: hypothetical protein EHM28_12905 [Spirochaetaceae bacterium]|nr:MAG: hypothetical protein EHM28_12905 [Spirochaetaceae bacterium]